MRAVAVHPSQRRFSCEGCRKIKTRCQRLHPNDTKCVRCTLVGLDCTTGQQKRVGRPRRVITADDEALKLPKNSDSTINNQQATPVKARSHVENPSTSHETSSNKGGKYHQDWAMNFPIDLSIAPIVTADDEAYFGAPAWPVVDVNSLDQNPLTWDASNDFGHTLFLSNDNSIFSSTSPSASSLKTLSTASSPADSIHNAEENIPETPEAHLMGFITNSDAMAQLSKINLDLHIRMVAVEVNRATLDFNSITYGKGPLFIGNLTLAQFLLEASQNFILILKRIISGRTTRGMPYATQTTETTLTGSLTLSSQSYLHKTHNPTSISSSTPSSASELLFAPLALIITSIFTQLITLCELNLELLTARIERIATNPIANLPSFTFGDLPLSEPCTQGMIFCEVVIHLLEGIEQALGLNSVLGASAIGLLSTRQKDVLWSELDGRPGIIPGHGMLRPINVRKAFGRVAMVLRQISLDRLTIRSS